MHVTENLLAAVMVGALILYLLGGGADFGGGVWDLLASGPRRREQRLLIEKAIGPIWEANHVWLILVVVVLFTAFPRAFFAISIALHLPLTLLLLGIVFRGSAFAFRGMEPKEDRGRDAPRYRWGLVFSIASVVSPVLLGINVGTIASGKIRVSGDAVLTGFVTPWAAPFPIAVGAFCLALCAFLAATYLAFEARAQPDHAGDFRLRALGSGAAVGVLALIAFVLSATQAPEIRDGLTGHPWTWPLHACTAAAAIAAFAALWRRRYGVARFCAAAQTALILLGWAASQHPYLVVPDVTVVGAAANPRTQLALLVALALGSVVLFPCLWVLYRIFKKT
jgi:cytochrome bd ubiquinol oxidase subunit II